MFSGIIRHVGRVQRAPQPAQSRFELCIQAEEFIREGGAQLVIGGSVAVNGVCLTITERTPTVLTFEVGSETLRRTTLDSLSEGRLVHLERSITPTELLEGHLVMGHVDEVVKVRNLVMESANTVRIELSASGALQPFLAPKGSVAIDGVSLTVGEVAADNFSVYVIPHTQEVTTLSDLAPGSEVNVEIDPVARYAVSYLMRSGRTKWKE